MQWQQIIKFWDRSPHDNFSGIAIIFLSVCLGVFVPPFKIKIVKNTFIFLSPFYHSMKPTEMSFHFLFCIFFLKLLHCNDTTYPLSLPFHPKLILSTIFIWSDQHYFVLPTLCFPIGPDQAVLLNVHCSSANVET